MQLPSIASLLNDTSPEKVVLPSVKELEQLKVSNNNQTPNVENSTVAVQQGFKSYNNNNTIPSSYNLYPISNSQQVSNNNQTHNQLTSYTCTSSTQQQNIPSSNNNQHLHYNYPPVTASTSQEDQRLQVSSTFLQQKDAYKNGMLKSHDIASDKYYDNYSNTRKWDESGSKLHSNPASQPIPVYQNKWSTTTSNVSTSNSATFKPIISPTSRNSPLSFTPSIVTTASSSSSNVSETKKKRKHDESSESTNSPNSSSPKLVKRNSGTSKKSSNSSSSSAPTAVASSFQFMNFSISSDSSKIKFVNSEHQQIGINDGSWTDQEHDDFVRGLNECGKGRWREIAEKYVKTRTRTQVASHAQKYFEAQKEKKK